MLVEALSRHRAELNLFRQGFQPWGGALPVIERRLERGRYVRSVSVTCEIARHDDQPPITSVFYGGELHKESLCRQFRLGANARATILTRARDLLRGIL